MLSVAQPPTNVVTIPEWYFRKMSNDTSHLTGLTDTAYRMADRLVNDFIEGAWQDDGGLLSNAEELQKRLEELVAVMWAANRVGLDIEEIFSDHLKNHEQAAGEETED